MMLIALKKCLRIDTGAWLDSIRLRNVLDGVTGAAGCVELGMTPFEENTGDGDGSTLDACLNACEADVMCNAIEYHKESTRCNGFSYILFLECLW